MAGFELRFVAMGMGDCALIKCPDGKVIIVDCGTSSEGAYNDPEVHIKYARLWLANNAPSGKIHAGVLTHADKDHYNRLVDMLFSKVVIDEKTQGPVDSFLKMENVYFSCPAGKINSHPLANYSENNVGGQIAGQAFETTGMFLVNLNDDKGLKNEVISYTVKKEEKRFTFSPASAKISGKPGKVVITSSTENNHNWSVEILAGNVGEHLDLSSDQKRKNANSLVVLLNYSGKKILLMGDADEYTQNYLLDSGSVAAHDKLELMTAPHHGSRKNFYAEFYKKIQALNMLVISSEFFEHKHSLPNYIDAMDQWEKKTKENLKLHNTYYWDVVKKKNEDEVLKLKKEWEKLETDDSKNPYQLDFNNPNTVGRWEPDDFGRTIIRKQTTQVNLLTEYQTKKNILQTATGSIELRLDDQGIKILKHPWDKEIIVDVMDEDKE